MKYRADIDGLRAIAILFVLIYHGGFSLFPSGFIGVDIFFVISGFLITTIIHNSLNQNNFSFFDFYNRRLWRLQPVLICFIVITSLACLLFFLPDDLTQFFRSARKTSLFISNLFFNQHTTGYFAPDTHQLPLLHTWSLSIEWQCYLILPAFMLLIHKLGTNKKNTMFLVWVLTLVSFGLSLYYSRVLPAQTYFQLSSRLFEFLIGSCVALAPWSPIKINKINSNILGGIALISLLFVASTDNILLGYPNEYALLVCLATALLITLGTSTPSNWVIRMLSAPPIVFIGVLSYSLYIWHWAIFSILRYQSLKENAVVLAIAYMLIFILAYLSWRFIEKPAKKFKNTKFAYTVIYLLVLPITFIHVSDAIIKKNLGFPQRFNEELVRVYQKLEAYSSKQRPYCISNKLDDTETRCRIGSDHAAKTGLMMGDSFANHYWGFMDTLGKAANVSILVQGVSSCITLPGIYLYDWWQFKNKIYKECYEETQHYYQLIKTNHYDYVILGQIWSNYLSPHIINQVGDARSLALSKQRLSAAVNQALKIIIDSGAIPVLIKTSALMQQNSHDCFFKHIKLRQKYHPEACSFNQTASIKDRWFDDLFKKMKVKYPQLILIDPQKVQCAHNLCPAEINGIPIYRDAGHITDYASYQFARLYLQKFKNPLL